MKLVLTGDVHLGRVSTRLRAGDAAGFDASTAAGWRGLVDHVVRERADVLLISGDVIDEGNKRWEATGPLEEGLHTLAAHGVDVVMVSGNHDHDVLPALMRRARRGHVRLLGEGGAWERHTLERDGRPVLHIDGYSFPRAHVQESPLATYHPPAGGGVPVIGLLHGDLDSPASRYGPLARSELQAAPVSAWLLGHIHAPRLYDAAARPWVLYPGSPQPLDPGEPGAHGVWTCDLAHGHLSAPVKRPIAAARYEAVELEAGGVEDPAVLEALIATRLREVAHACAEESAGSLRALSVRLTVRGHAPLGRHLDAQTPTIERELTVTESGVTASIDRITNALRPPLDLDDLARGSSAVAMLAALVRDLEAGVGSPAADAAVRQVRQTVGAALQRGASVFAPLQRSFDPEAPRSDTGADARDLTLRQARALLSQLREADT